MSARVTIQDLFGVWQHVQGHVEKRSSLKNLKVRGQNRSSRVVNSVALDLCPFAAVSDQKSSQFEGVLEKPILNIFVLKCEEVELYRGHARQMIRDWYNLVVARPGQQWMILHVVASDPDGSATSSRATGSKFLNMRGSVFDKIKSDFNGSSKQDHCAQLRLGDSQPEMNEAVDGLMIKVQFLVELGLADRMSAVEQEIQRTKSTQRNPGWNFCTFFILQESLALAYSALSLFDDALAQYDELEVNLDNALFDEHLVLFKGSGGLMAEDLSETIFDEKRKPYQDLILKNEITLYDFCVYLFSRQMSLLICMNRIDQLLFRGLKFISAMSQSFEVHRQAHPYFIESWTILAINHILALIRPQHYDQAIASTKGDLLNMQRSAYLRLYRSLSTDNTDMEGRANIGNVKYPYRHGVVHETLSSEVKLTKRLQTLNEAILIDYKYAQRINGTVYITLRMAMDFYAIQDHTRAVSLFESIIDFDNLISLRSVLDSQMRCYLECLREIQQHLKLVQTCLAILACDKYPSLRLDAVLYITKVQTNLDSIVNTNLSSFISASIRPFLIECNEDAFNLRIQLTLQSFLPCDLTIDQIQLQLRTTSKRVWTFSAIETKVSSGEQIVNLHSTDYFPGFATPEQLTFQWGSVYMRQGISTQNSIMSRVSDPPLSVCLTRPRNLQLDRSRRIELRICTSSFDLNDCKLRITSLHDDFHPLSSEIQFVQERREEREIMINGSEVSLGTVPRAAFVSIEIPYETRAPIRDVKGLVQFKYKAAGADCEFAQIVEGKIHLPLAVTVQDFYRQDRLFSRFQVVSTDTSPIRLLSCHLHSSNTFKVVNTVSTGPQMMLQNSPYSQLVHIAPVCQDSEHEPLLLMLRYCQVSEEIQRVLKAALLEQFGRCNLSAFTKGLLLNHLVDRLEGVDINQSAIQNAIIKCQGFNEGLDLFYSTIEENDREAVADVVRTTYNIGDLSLVANYTEDLDYCLKIPVDIPDNVVVHTASFQMSSCALVVGLATRATLVIHNSMAWSKVPETQTATFTYEIEADESNWVVVGRRIGDFCISTAVHVDFDLVPIRPGVLTLPSVEIQSHNSALTSETYLASANLEVSVAGRDENRSIQF